MFGLQAEACFDAAHFLAGHSGACRNLHGHRWRIVAELRGGELAAGGSGRDMLVDFAGLKQQLRALAAEFDHKLIYEAGTLRPATLAALREEDFALAELPFRPTAERLAQYFYHRLQADGLMVARVTVYETPENCAAYWEAE
ncbi:MAG: 6-carboxytetrahydropterin synthase [Firmicutes bacterium]|nr:6-carboxytetrahydropterin synthase [Bacillota bacterium]